MTVIDLRSPKPVAIPARPFLMHSASIAVAARYSSYLSQDLGSADALPRQRSSGQDRRGVLSFI